MPTGFSVELWSGREDSHLPPAGTSPGLRYHARSRGRRRRGLEDYLKVPKTLRYSARGALWSKRLPSFPLCLSVKRAPVAQRTERVASDQNPRALCLERRTVSEMSRVFRSPETADQGAPDGAYSSAEAGVLPPPTTSTVPLSKSVAVWPRRAKLMLPVTVQVPLRGS
jgi:hypothetical protein